MSDQPTRKQIYIPGSGPGWRDVGLYRPETDLELNARIDVEIAQDRLARAQASRHDEARRASIEVVGYRVKAGRASARG